MSVEIKNKTCPCCRVEKPLTLQHYGWHMYDYYKTCTDCMNKRRKRKTDKEEFEKQNIVRLEERVEVLKKAITFLETEDNSLYDLRMQSWIGRLDDTLKMCESCIIVSLKKEIDRLMISIEELENLQKV